MTDQEALEAINRLTPGLEAGMKLDAAYHLIAERLKAYETAIKKARAAITYSYEDSGDLYFQNVLDDIEVILGNGNSKPKTV